MKPAQSACVSVTYNENKINRTNEVSLFMVHNINGDSRADIDTAFLMLERNPAVSIQMKNFGLHCVFSLGPEDDIEEPTLDERIHGYINEWTKRMGYSEQPFAVYCHQDTGHRHYHLVSTRVNAEGKKIDDSNEKYRDLALLKELAPKYGFTVGNGTALLEEKRHERYQEQKSKRGQEMLEKKRQWGYPTMERFNIRKGDVMEQFRKHFEEALTYNYTSLHQFAAIMAARGIMVRQAKFKGDPKESLVFQGLSRRGVSVTRLYTEDEVNINALELVLGIMQQNKQEHNVQYREKIRVENIAKKLFEWSTSQQHYEKMLKKKGIDVVFSHEEDKPRHIIGATFVDHISKTAFKASELDKSIAASVFDKAVENGHWKYWDTTKDMDEENYITEWQEDELSTEIRTALNLLGKDGGPLFQNTHGNHAGKTQNQIAWEKQQAEEEQQAQMYQHRM